MQNMEDSISNTVKWLAFGPREAVQMYEGYDVNGYSFWTERQDMKSLTTQNSGVSIEASSIYYVGHMCFQHA